MSNKCRIDSLGKIIEVNHDESLLSALKRNNITVRSSCGGCASCGDCVIELLSGSDDVSEIEHEERKLLGNVFHLTKERLACQLKLRGDIEIEISKHPQTPNVRAMKTALRKKSEGQTVDKKDFEKKVFKVGGKKKPKSFKYSQED